VSTVRYRVPFARREPAPVREKPVPRVARQLALAHHVDELVESGELESYSAAARLLGISDTRIVQVLNLKLLSPRIQEGILEGTIRIDGRSATKVARRALWSEQEKKLVKTPASGEQLDLDGEGYRERR
jgi:hypothetical protein